MEDGRFRPANKEWADGIYIPKDRRNYEFSVGSHPEIVNGLITDYRQYLSDVLHQYGVGDCLPGSNHVNYEHQLLILNPFLLHEDYKHGDYQLFYATSGNGCDESNIGLKVFGRFLKDDEHTHFYRDEFLGIADESKLPEWATQKLEEIRAGEDEGMVLSCGSESINWIRIRIRAVSSSKITSRPNGTAVFTLPNTSAFSTVM